MIEVSSLFRFRLLVVVAAGAFFLTASFPVPRVDVLGFCSRFGAPTEFSLAEPSLPRLFPEGLRNRLALMAPNEIAFVANLISK